MKDSTARFSKRALIACGVLQILGMMNACRVISKSPGDDNPISLLFVVFGIAAFVPLAGVFFKRPRGWLFYAWMLVSILILGASVLFSISIFGS